MPPPDGRLGFGTRGDKTDRNYTTYAYAGIVPKV